MISRYKFYFKLIKWENITILIIGSLGIYLISSFLSKETPAWIGISGSILLLLSFILTLSRYLSSDQDTRTKLSLSDAILALEEIHTNLGFFTRGENLNETDKSSLIARISNLYDSSKSWLSPPYIEVNSLDLTSDSASYVFQENIKRNLERLRKVENSDNNQNSTTLGIGGDNRQTRSINEIYGSSVNRITKEIFSLNKKANYYLIAGSSITLLAASFLVYFVEVFIKNSQSFPAEISTEAPTTFLLYHFYPLAIRVSILLFIEIFAMYFFRLYKSSIADIKYYQNEITNIQQRQIAVLSAFNSNNNEFPFLKIPIEHLSRTERNSIHKKDETTSEIEKERIEKNIAENISIQLENILKKISTS